MSGSQTCSAPHTVEWRVRGNVQKLDKNERNSRAAVCILGLARSIDWTIASMERHLLNKIGIAHELFAFVSAGLVAGSCQEFHDLSSIPSMIDYPKLGFSTFEFLATAVQGTKEWAALLTLLHRAVAARVDWSDRPLDLLKNSKVWKWSLRRPGGWIGGAIDDKGDRRPASGLAQLRSLQWCADAVRWREDNVFGHRYTHVVFTRWDLQWVLPFPGIPLLSGVNPEAVWIPVTQSAFFRNDRFAVVPRHAMGAYFEGWKLVVNGHVEKVFESVLPHCGLPVYDSQVTSTEAFLFARLKHANIETKTLPAMAFVHCTSGPAMKSYSHTSCSAFSEIFGGVEPGGWLDELNQLLGGSKYPTEVDAILLADLALNPEEYSRPLPERLANRILQGCEKIWTHSILLKATALSEEVEIEQMLRFPFCGQGLTGAVAYRFSRGCRDLRARLLELGRFQDALDIARAAAMISPLVLEHWLWLAKLLISPPFSQRNAAAAAFWEAYALNPSHSVVTTLVSLSPVSKTIDFLSEALGGSNASWHLLRRKERSRQWMMRRRILQGDCSDHPASTRLGLNAWLRFGEHLRKHGWLLAAVSVLEHLENVHLADMRPEVQRTLIEAEPRIQHLQSRILSRIEDIGHWATPWLVGLSLPILRHHAVPASTLTDPNWLKQQEALLLQDGVETEATTFLDEYTNADAIRKTSGHMCVGATCPAT